MMILRAIFLWLPTAIPLMAQDFSALARVDMSASQIIDTRRGLSVELALSQVVPYRVYMLDAPTRLVLDFKEVDWTGVSEPALLNADRATGLRYGSVETGWSRLVIALSTPLLIDTAGVVVDQNTGTAQLSIDLAPTDPETFAANAGAPVDPTWGTPRFPAPPENPDGRLIVVLDPGHGGLEPGAQRGGVKEADLMLTLAREVEDALRRSGQIVPVLTRNDDSFVSLDARRKLARAVGADVLISLHADALTEGQATGATIYTLSDEASDLASQQLATKLSRDDLLAGVDLTGRDDQVATILMDLARQETEPRTATLAEALVEGLGQQGVKLNSRPLRRAEISVLKSPEIPSVLIEVGFLSNDADLLALQDPATRNRFVGGILRGVLLWSISDAKTDARRLR